MFIIVRDITVPSSTAMKWAKVHSHRGEYQKPVHNKADDTTRSIPSPLIAHSYTNTLNRLPAYAKDICIDLPRRLSMPKSFMPAHSFLKSILQDHSE